jgi:hypothetical protein
MPPRLLFADTFYWIALLNPRDAFHAVALSYGRTLGSTRHVTTDLVLVEVLNRTSIVCFAPAGGQVPRRVEKVAAVHRIPTMNGARSAGGTERRNSLIQRSLAAR